MDDSVSVWRIEAWEPREVSGHWGRRAGGSPGSSGGVVQQGLCHAAEHRGQFTELLFLTQPQECCALHTGNM